MLPVSIENDALKMEVWPQLGGKVASLIDKADQYELLFNFPAELPTTHQYDIPYAKGWYAGWDECFPAVHPSKYVGHPYDGIAVPDHGELWGLPTTAVPTRDGITTVWHGLRFGYRLTRKLYLEGSSVVADYTLINLAPFDFWFVWSMHALMSMESPVRLNPGEASEFHLLDDAAPSTTQLHTFTWPLVPDGGDLSDPARLPAGCAWQAIGTKPLNSPLTVEYTARHRRARIEFIADDDVQAYCGVWINTGGWLRHRHFGLRPTIGRFYELDRSIRDHSAGKVAPLGRAQWEVRWTVEAE